MSKCIKSIGILALVLTMVLGVTGGIVYAAQAGSAKNKYCKLSAGYDSPAKVNAAVKNISGSSRYTQVFLYGNGSAMVAHKEGSLSNNSSFSIATSEGRSYSYFEAQSVVCNSSTVQSGVVSGGGLKVRISR